jgi:class 3 adenylate cyclase
MEEHMGYVETSQTFLCSDVVGFTAMTERLGDLRALEVMNRANRNIRSRALRFDGVEWELRGDGFLFTFPTPRQALLAGIAIHEVLQTGDDAVSGQSVAVRIAMHCGPAYCSEQRLFGHNVILAFRLLNYAARNSIVVSDDARIPLEREWRSCFSRRSKVRPKGFSHKVAFSTVNIRVGEHSERVIPLPVRQTPESMRLST